jgi:integrase
MLNWMIANGRIAHNPLRTVKKVEVRPVRMRRAFSDNEITRLLQVAGESGIGYLLAVHTGLRRGELKNLLWRHIHLDADVPYLLLDGQFTKNDADAYIPLHPEVVSELHRFKPSHANPTDFVLVGKMLPSMWKMKSDLKKAGIEFKENGRCADFHALRHTFCTRLARLNIPPRVAMQLMRHSDMKLTMNHYTDVSGLPLADAVKLLPAFGSSTITGEYAQILTQNSGATGTGESHPVTAAPTLAPPQIIQVKEL